MCAYVVLLFFKQKTAYEMRISDWSSDVCSSDLVGDAAMNPYEIAVAGGSVEHMNAEAGGVWIKRLVGHFRRSVWLNPVQERFWKYTQSVAMVQGIGRASCRERVCKYV